MTDDDRPEHDEREFLEEELPPLEELLFTNIYGRDDLRVADLKDKEHIVTIVDAEAVLAKKFGTNDQIPRVLLHLKEFDKPLLLNVVNGRRVYDLYGDTVADWIGQRITLYPSETELAGKTVKCIRVREQPPPKVTRKRRPSSGKKRQRKQTTARPRAGRSGAAD